MREARKFISSESGATAAEFAMILPVFILFLLGTIDLGHYAWKRNLAEKATQVGARWAVATDIIPGGLYSYSFATSDDLPQGSVVPRTRFPGVVCQDNGGGLRCDCAAGGSCNFGLTPNTTAFNRLVAQMNQVYTMGGNAASTIGPRNVVVTYSWSGLGFAGDPNGPDVAPLTTVSLKDMEFNSILLLGGTVRMPAFPYTLPMEDGSGTTSN